MYIGVGGRLAPGPTAYEFHGREAWRGVRCGGCSCVRSSVGVFVGRGSWVVGRGSWVVVRGSWFVGGGIENVYALPPDPYLKKETMTGVIW